ncbi:hypothetical protein [Streptomyces sp. NPDC002785]|uniref:hypothetical protein n=1 Tax=Streptomyces sp. NPDC002785 TaxID=3154543 RepID=UPI0033332CB8
MAVRFLLRGAQGSVGDAEVLAHQFPHGVEAGIGRSQLLQGPLDAFAVTGAPPVEAFDGGVTCGKDPVEVRDACSIRSGTVICASA